MTPGVTELPDKMMVEMEQDSFCDAGSITAISGKIFCSDTMMLPIVVQPVLILVTNTS